MTKGMQRLRSPRALACAATLVVGLSLACSGRGRVARSGGRVTQDQAENYLHAAIRQSSEGIVLDPQQQGLDQIERVRLGEIAQELRGPAAVCFLERAIQTMEPGMIDGEPGWVAVPEGQAKFRARVAVDGTVMTTDVLESGFTDDHMETCVSEAIRKQRFVESRDSFAYYIDVYYWVSLGFFAAAQTEDFAQLMRRQQAEAATKASKCLQGRVPPGKYLVTGVNLFDRDGRTLVNRVERGSLPPEVSSCIAGVFKQIHIHAEPDAFVRPAAPEVEFEVAEDGTVSFADQRWLELVQLEERAARDKRQAELLGRPIGADDGADDGDGDGLLDPGEPEPRDESSLPDPSLAPRLRPTGDPTQPGTKIDLSPRRGR